MKKYIKLVRLAGQRFSKQNTTNDLTNVNSTDLTKQLDQKVDVKVTEKLNESKDILKDIDMDNIVEKMDAIDQPVEIEVSKAHANLFVKNPLKEGDYIMTNEDEIQSNEDYSLRLKDNQFGKEVISSGRFDLADKRVELRNNASSSLFLDRDSDYKTFSLGSTQMLDKGSVYIDDIDVNRIPAHLNIDLNKEEKEIVVLGKMIDADSKAEQDNDGKETIDKEIFNEKSYTDMFKKTFNGFEKFIIRTFNLRLIKLAIKWVPAFIFITALMVTIDEERQCYESVHRIEEDKLKYLNILKYGRQLD